MVILTFDDNEDELLKRVLSIVEPVIPCIKDTEKGFLEFQGIKIDKLRRVVMRNEEEITLTYTEFEILQLLASNPGTVFSKEQIYDIVWKELYSGDYNIVMSHVRNIREKIEDNPSKPVYIQTVWGIGYRFNKNLSSGL